MVQELEALAQQTQVLPGLANKVLIAVGSRKDGGPRAAASAVPPAVALPAKPRLPARQDAAAGAVPPATPAGAVLQRRAAVPLRMVGRLVSGAPTAPPAIPPAPAS
jgi:hypothetical protein